MQLDLLTEESPAAAMEKVMSPPPKIRTAMKHPPASEKPVPSTSVPAVAQEISDEEKAPSAFRTISEVANFLNVPQHVLRFWESRFSQIKPLKLNGGRRYYRPEDIETLTTIKNLLYKQGYTIKGARKAFGHLADHENPAAPAVQQAAAVKVKAVVTDRQLSQLAVIRHELLSLRDMLKPYID